MSRVTAPFTVLHVCMGNICRSPMAERLLAAAVRGAFGQAAGEVLYSHSAGTGGWHAGSAMQPPAAREVRRRGGDPAGFAARRLLAEHLDASDLILTATAEQSEYVVSLRPDAAGRTFVFGEFGRLLGKIDRAPLPPASRTPDGVYARATALVEAADAVRAGAPPEPGDELDDPYGLPQRAFTEVADQIDETVGRFVGLLTG